MSGDSLKKLVAIIFALTLFLSLRTVYSQGSVFFYGQVVDENGSPIGSAQLTVYRGIYIVTSATTKNDGSFSLFVQPGSYTLVIYKKGYSPLYYSFEVTPEKGGSLGLIVLKKGVSVVPEATAISASQGDNVRINLRIYNSCLDPLLVNFSFVAPRDWEIALVDSKGLAVNNVYLNPGENKTLTLVANVPLNATELSLVSLYYYWANLSSRIDFTFRIAQKNWKFFNVPTAVIKGFPGAQIVIPVNITSPLSIDIPVTLYLITPPNIIATLVDENGLAVQTIVAKPSMPRRLQLLLYVSPNAQLSTYTIKLVAKTSFAQQIENIQVDVESSYDLLKINVNAASLNATSGSTLSLKFILENDGNMPTVALVKASANSPLIRVYISTSGENLASIYLMPGEKKTLSLVIELDTLLPPGVYLLTLSANGTTSTATQGITIVVSGTRRLEVLTTNFKVTGRPGSVATFKLVLANKGTVTLKDIVLQVDSPSKDISVSFNPTRLSLPPNSTASFDLSIYISQNVTEGMYNIPLTIIAGEIKTSRIIVLEVTAEQGLSYPLMAVGIFVTSLAVVYYSNKRQRK
jgi:uncharacterized membrane protein